MSVSINKTMTSSNNCALKAARTLSSPLDMTVINRLTVILSLIIFQVYHHNHSGDYLTRGTHLSHPLTCGVLSAADKETRLHTTTCEMFINKNNSCSPVSLPLANRDNPHTCKLRSFSRPYVEECDQASSFNDLFVAKTYSSSLRQHPPHLSRRVCTRLQTRSG